MEKIEEYKQKVRADIALLEAELTRFKVRGVGFTTNAKAKHDERIEMLEEEIDKINTDLSTLDKEADEQRFEYLKNDINQRWRVMQATFRHATRKFQTEPGVADAHGGDDGPYPYGIKIKR
jgi:hypothetical protein